MKDYRVNLNSLQSTIDHLKGVGVQTSDDGLQLMQQLRNERDQAINKLVAFEWFVVLVFEI